MLRTGAAPSFIAAPPLSALLTQPPRAVVSPPCASPPQDAKPSSVEDGMENVQRERAAAGAGAPRRPESLSKFDKMCNPLPVSIRLTQLGLLDSLRDAAGLHGGDPDFVGACAELVGRLAVPWRVAKAATGVHGGGDSVLAEAVLSGEKPKGRQPPPVGTPPLFLAQGETEEVQRVAVVSFNAMMRGLLDVVAAMSPIRLCSLYTDRRDVLVSVLRMVSRLLLTAHGSKAAGNGTGPLFMAVLDGCKAVMPDLSCARDALTAMEVIMPFQSSSTGHDVQLLARARATRSS